MELQMRDIELPKLQQNENWSIETLEQSISQKLMDCREEDKPLFIWLIERLKIHLETKRIEENYVNSMEERGRFEFRLVLSLVVLIMLSKKVTWVLQVQIEIYLYSLTQ